jgi:2,5-diketo-D-gluconate reductase A
MVMPRPPIPEVELNNGVAIPQLGFGTLMVDQDRIVDVLASALRVGYRHFDTASAYGNERELGQAIVRADLDPSEVFVTSKLRSNVLTFDGALEAFDQTLDNLALERIGLYLIHWPVARVHDFVETWRAFERIYSEGRVGAIGVSNFQILHLRRLLTEADVVPAVNQIECHPYLSQVELHDFDGAHGIITEAWSPLAQGAVMGDETIGSIAERLGRTRAQVVLRWQVQRGIVVIPKSDSHERMEENLTIFDFELSDADMDRLAACNRDQRFGPDPDSFVHPDNREGLVEG